MHITNADGSVPEMCGNGLRCVSQWLLEKGLVQDDESHVIETDAGLKTVSFTEGLVRAEMGAADFDSVVPDAPMIQTWFEAGSQKYQGTAVSMGNPHLVLEAEPSAHTVQQVGPIFECHPSFPARTNVGFLKISDVHEIDLAVWERGAGYTQACGTGACAAVAAAVKTNRCPADAWIQVNLPGGALHVLAEKGSFVMHMKGPALKLWEGTIQLNDLPA